MAKFTVIETPASGDLPARWTVVNLPDAYRDGDLYPAPTQSDSPFATRDEALDELQQRVDGKQPCQCGCGGYPKGIASRFLPGHDLRKAYQDQGKSGNPN